MTKALEKIEDLDLTEIIKKDKIESLMRGEKRARLEKFQNLVQTDPRKHKILRACVKKHPIYNTPYLPIGIQQTLLDQIYFGLWQTKNVKWKQVLNEVCYTVELEVFHPVQEIWLTYTGAGAVPIQQEKGSRPDQIEKKYTRALEKDFPNADAHAFGNACKKIGKIFGRDLGRDAKDTIEYKGMISDSKVQNMHKSIADLIEQEVENGKSEN